MEDLIAALHDKIAELLEQAQDLDAALQNAPQSESTVEKVADLLKRVCNALSETLKMLNDPQSPLHVLARRLENTPLGALPQTLGKFLEEHRQFLEKIVRLPGPTVDKIIDYLKDETEARYTDVDVFDSADLIKTLESFRDLVCEISGYAHDLAFVWDPQLIKPIVKGVIGTCMAVGDVTGAIIAHQDPTGWVLVKAIKSTVSGVRTVKKSINAIKERLPGWLSKVKQGRMQRNNPPPPRL